jgi:hypothetical protein
MIPSATSGCDRIARPRAPKRMSSERSSSPAAARPALDLPDGGLRDRPEAVHHAVESVRRRRRLADVARELLDTTRRRRATRPHAAAS